MQVSSSVSSRYYTPYQTNKSVKYCAGFTQTEDGKMKPNETTENPGFAEFVDYQEFHKAWMSQGAKTAFSYTRNEGFNAEANSISLVPGMTVRLSNGFRLGSGQKVNSDYQINTMSSDAEPVYAKQTGAVSIAESEDGGEFLGLTMVPEEGQSVTYGMRAMLSEKSTPDNPIVQVISNLGGEKIIYNVEVNKVNPNNATQLEMFALLSYTDKMGITDGGSFGSHQQLEVYGGNASSIGYCNSLSGADVFLNEKFDWTSIMEKMVQVYKDAGIDNQAEDCKALVDFFRTYSEQSENKADADIDFSRFAPNAPEEVRKAFSEAAEETGYYEYSGKGKMNYISQILVRQVENRQNGVANYTDVFGSTVASALQAAREMLYDLENPLMPDSQRSEDVIKYREQEKEFYRTFIAKLEGVSNTGNVLGTQERIENCISARYATGSTKENPIVEVSLQIGGETITQEINISEVNPRKATQLEMYAFFYHQDMVSGKGGENTYRKFSEYVENAVQNGHFEGNQSYGDFTEKEHDWQKVIISMWEDYSDAGLYSQMQECIKLNEAMEKASIQFVDFDKITFVNKSSEVFFTYSGINVPKQLRVAWMEIAGAIEDTEKYGHLTRVLYRRIEAELEGKDLQDEAGAIDAAIEAVKKALQDLEDTPTETIANNPDTKKEIQELKSYYEAFMQKLEALKENSAETTEATIEGTAEDITFSYQEFFAMYMEQIFIKIQNGDTEPTYQIGSQSFTEKEWETFLEKFDSVEEAIQELIKEEQARKEAEEAKHELTGTVSAGNGVPGNYGLETWYQGEKVEWSANDAKYTDPETGITYYVRDGKYPYMTEEDAEKLKELCQETGEPWLKKFAEITGMIQQLDDNTTAYVGSNGTVIKSKDGKELFIDTSSLTYDAIMSLFKELPKNGNYFDSSFWEERIRTAEKENTPDIDDGALLTAETTSCRYEAANPDDDDILYVTFYTEDGIRCKKLGEEDFEWSIAFENKAQYNKVIEFLGNFPSDWNMRFAAHENFWNDFLNDEIDMDGFMEFINETGGLQNLGNWDSYLTMDKWIQSLLEYTTKTL